MTTRRDQLDTPPQVNDATQGDLWQAGADLVMAPIDRTGITDGSVVVWDAGLQLHRYAVIEGVGGHWEPVTNGDPDDPQLIFSDGDVVMTFVPD